MRTILICANLILAAFVAFHGYEWLNEPTVEAEVATSVTKERRASTPQPRPVTAPPRSAQPAEAGLPQTRPAPLRNSCCGAGAKCL